MDFAIGNIEVVTTDAPGAWIKGTRVRKTEQMPTDTHKIGAKATIVGSIGPADVLDRKNLYGYFVEWDDLPGVPVFVVGFRLEPVETDGPDVPIDKKEGCDFCVVGFKPVRVYRCYDFVVQDVAIPKVLMTGGWAACRECAEFIDAERWDALDTFAATRWIEKYRIHGLEEIAKARAAVAWGHKNFRAYRVKA